MEEIPTAEANACRRLSGLMTNVSQKKRNPAVISQSLSIWHDLCDHRCEMFVKEIILHEPDGFRGVTMYSRARKRGSDGSKVGSFTGESTGHPGRGFRSRRVMETRDVEIFGSKFTMDHYRNHAELRSIVDRCGQTSNSDRIPIVVSTAI